MILSPNIIRILFGWDGLELISYCLMIFYQNYMFYNSRIVIVLCNRVGDVGLLIGIGLLIIKGRWNYWICGKCCVSFFVGTMLLHIQHFLWSSFWPTNTLLHWNILYIRQIWHLVTFFLFLNWNRSLKEHVLSQWRKEERRRSKEENVRCLETETDLFHAFDQWKTRSVIANGEYIEGNKH